MSVEPAQQVSIASINTPNLVVDSAFALPDAHEHHELLQDPLDGFVDDFPGAHDAPLDNFADLFDFDSSATTDYSFTDHASQLVDLGAPIGCDGSVTIGF